MKIIKLLGKCSVLTIQGQFWVVLWWQQPVAMKNAFICSQCEVSLVKLEESL